VEEHKALVGAYDVTMIAWFVTDTSLQPVFYDVTMIAWFVTDTSLQPVFYDVTMIAWFVTDTSLQPVFLVAEYVYSTPSAPKAKVKKKRLNQVVFLH